MADQALSNPNIAKQRILSAQISEFNKEFMESLFAGYYDKESGKPMPPPFAANTKIQLSHSEYQYVKDTITTTLGLLFMNRFLLEYTGIIPHLGYWNKPLDSKALGLLDTLVSNLVITKKITTEINAKYVDRREMLGFQAATFLSTSISAALIRPMPDVEQRKMELFKEYEEDLNSRDPVKQLLAANKITDELMGMVRKHLEHDPGYDLYASGDGNLNNNYKTINVMRGEVFNSITQRFDIVESSLMGGIRKQDIPAFSNSVVAGAYPSAIGTADAGYMAKIILALLQSEHIDPDPDSDCGSVATIPFLITEKNKQFVYYRNINHNGKRVMLTLDNVDSYVGQTVQMYSPQCCLHEGICGKCGGRVFHNLGVQNIGLLVTNVTQALLNLKLKSKHDLTQKASIIDKSQVFETDNKYFHIHEGKLVPNTPMKIYIPRLFEEFDGFTLEATGADCFGVLPVKFFNNDGTLLLSTRMVIPSTLHFVLYDDIQEDPEYYILSYDADDEVCSLAARQSLKNVEFYINQIYLHSKTPQIPYNLMTNMMFRCLELNNINLHGPSITYELLARRMCRHNGKPFAFVYGKDPNVNPLSYDKEEFRSAVQRSGILQGLLFQDISTSINIGLAQTIRGVKPTQTPLEMVVKA